MPGRKAIFGRVRSRSRWDFGDWSRVERPQRGAPGVPGFHPSLRCYVFRVQAETESRASISSTNITYCNRRQVSSRGIKVNLVADHY